MPTKSDVQSALASPEAWLEYATRSVHSEVCRLRSRVRYFAALSQAPVDRWFGGSDDLRGCAWEGSHHGLLMRLRRLTDKHKKGTTWRDAELSIEALLSVRHDHAAHQDRTDLEALVEQARRLRDDPDVRHLRRIADKGIAHPNPLGLVSEPAHPEGLPAGSMHLAMLAKAIATVSAVFAAGFPGYGLDSSYLGGDPFCYRIVRDGLPVLDFRPPEAYSPRPWDLRSGRHVTVDADAWEEMIAAVSKPVSRRIALADLRLRWDARDVYPEPRALALRWGWSVDAAMGLISESSRAPTG